MFVSRDIIWITKKLFSLFLYCTIDFSMWLFYLLLMAFPVILSYLNIFYSSVLFQPSDFYQEYRHNVYMYPTCSFTFQKIIKRNKQLSCRNVFFFSFVAIETEMFKETQTYVCFSNNKRNWTNCQIGVRFKLLTCQKVASFVAKIVQRVSHVRLHLKHSWTFKKLW